MAATLIGDVGIWGLSSEIANGIIIEKIDDTTKKKSKDVINHAGERVGRSDYDQSISISLSGKYLAGDTFAQKISTDLVMANAISTSHLFGTVSGGRTLVDEIKRSRANEDWRGLDIEAEFLPYFGED